MQVRRFARISGIVMLAMGVLALIPALSDYPLSSSEPPGLKLETSYGLFLGIFPMNILNKLALIGFGIAGIAATRTLDPGWSSIVYSRVLLVTTLVLTLLGMVPSFDSLGGYWPLFGNEIGFHAVVAIISGYFGFKDQRKHKADIYHAEDYRSSSEDADFRRRVG